MNQVSGRPDPDRVLHHVQKQELQKKRGKLKIFFGAAPGVGKTYAMLEEARKLYSQGVDVSVGVVEPHGRSETAMLLLGLDILAPRIVNYRETTLSEFDLDAALARRPALILMDELAHANAPGSRFEKRHQDVAALLDAGMDVFTTLNVQHLESFNDIIAQITEIEVRETVPDSIFDEADEVELIDLPPDELLSRLQAGKIYISQVAANAILHFFRKGNLSALRELALRRTAQWVDGQMQKYKREQGIAGVWPASERILVCVGSGPNSGNVLRASKRLAISLRADLIALYVEDPLRMQKPAAEREEVLSSLRLAEQLGAETVILNNSGPGPGALADRIIQYAKSRNVNKVVVGRSRKSPWRERLFGSTPLRILQQCSDLDIFIIQDADGLPGGEQAPGGGGRVPFARPTSPPRHYGFVVVVTAVITALAALMDKGHFSSANIAMIYLLGVLVISVATGRGPSIFATILSVAAFDFFFVPPKLTFAIADSEYIITFVVMLAVAFVSSSLTVRIREQAEAARARERQTSALYAMSRELAAARDFSEVLQIGRRHIRETLEGDVAILYCDAAGKLDLAASRHCEYTLGDIDNGAAQWVFDHLQSAGLGTMTLPSAQALYLPMKAAQGVVGAAGFKPRAGAPLAPAKQHLLETFVSQLSFAIERVQLLKNAQDAQLRSETERMRNALLSSVSHDLKTPLAVITGTATTLSQNMETLSPETRRMLADDIHEESNRLARLIENLVFATRLDDGSIQLKKDWCSVEEIVGSALARVEDRLKTREVKTMVPADLPMIKADGVLLEQVLLNLLENALRYTPESTPIEISAWREGGRQIIKIADRGPGIPEGEEEKLFERFYRGGTPPSSPGLGLGLYICRGIVEAHGGRIWGERRADRGSVFNISLPAPESSSAAPAVELENI
ncbi:MAG: sensor histidine kinase KdpD [Planctomycetes bacterium]|nr:sensor histidine kinase KdpD [Planctomycetota bacterium]